MIELKVRVMAKPTMTSRSESRNQFSDVIHLPELATLFCSTRKRRATAPINADPPAAKAENS
jgi:hypothetical protein